MKSYRHTGAIFVWSCVSIILAKGEPGLDSFKTTYLEAVQLQKKGKYTQAQYSVKKSKPQKHLAKLYKKILMADLTVQRNQLNSAYSLYEDALKQTQSPVWEKYILEKLYKAFSRDHHFSKSKRNFYQRQTLENASLPDSLQITMLLDLLNYVDSWDVKQDYLKRLFLLDPLDLRLKEAYQKYVIDRPYSQNMSMEFSIAQYEEDTHKYKKASDRVLYILNSTRIKKQEEQAREIYVRLCLKTKEYDKGIRSGKKYLRLSPPNPEVFLNIARLYKGKKEKEKSRYWYNRFIKKFPDHYKTEEIYWIRGWEAEQDRNYKVAVQWYKKLLPRFENKKRGRWVRFRIGFCYYKQKNYAKALNYFRQAEKQVESRLSISASSYWKANVLKEMGKLDSAYNAYIESHQSYPYTFYGHLALKKMRQLSYKLGKGKKERVQPKSLKWLGEEKTKEWILATYSSNKNKIDSLYLGSSSLPISDLMANGLDTLAKITIESEYERYKNNILFLYHYSKIFQKYFPKFSYKLARRLSYRMSLENISQAPGEVVSLFNPLHYKEVVEKYGIQNKVPNFFIKALMKQESGFQAEVISKAGAIGLMQIMPATGANLAKGLDIADYDPSYLRIPDFNVMLGVEYLRRLMDTYNSNLFLVLANYNAGPQPTKRWQKQNGHKPLDEFVEEVSYWETRDYLKKVMGNYWNYEYIYGSKPR